MIVEKTADSAVLSKTGGGVGKLLGFEERNTKLTLIQALLCTVE